MGWGWYTCPMYDSCPYTREHQSLVQQEEASFGGGLMTIHVGSSLHRRIHQLHDLSYHLPSLFFPPILNLPLSLPGIWPSCSTRLPGFKFTVPIFLSLVPFLLACFCGGLGLCLQHSTPQPISHRSLCTCPHSWWRPLSWGFCCCQWWGRQS